MLNYIPRFFTSKAIYLYISVLIFCNIVFIAHSLPFLYWLFGVVEVIGFFYFSNLMTRQWANVSPKDFVRKLFWLAFIIRLVWVFFSYFFYIYMTGQPFEYSAGDSIGYHGEAQWLSGMITKWNLQPYYDYIKGRYSDMGYAYYLGWQYWITGSSILIARILKALYGALMCILIYKLARRNFGDSVARMAAIFCMLMPNLIYYSGIHTKEVEMVFITVLYIERADFLLRHKRYNYINIAIPLFLASSLFFFRTVLGATALFSFFSALLFSSNKVLGMGKRTMLIVWGLVAASYFVGGKIANEVEDTWALKTNNQGKSLDFRSTRKNGNSFAKYASSAVFVPLIFVIPFPTLVQTPNQENMQLIHGGNYVKNILSFFVLFSIYWVIKYKKWRDYALIGSFTIGYLLVIANSAFAQSERFHQPALPFLLILAAFGVSKMNDKVKMYFNWYNVVIFAAIVVWSWYKLAGRGLS